MAEREESIPLRRVLFHNGFFKLSNIRTINLTKPLPSGQTELTHTPLELLDRLAALIPLPRRHRHQNFGAFAPHARWRARVTAGAGNPVTETAPVPVPDPTLPVLTRRRASIHWARLLARIYEIRPLACPRCIGAMRLIAFLTEPTAIRAILSHLGEATTPPPLAPRARAPPELEAGPVGSFAFAFDSVAALGSDHASARSRPPLRSDLALITRPPDTAPFSPREIPPCATMPVVAKFVRR